MPVSRQIDDCIGPRWPATVGLVIAAVGNYLLHTINLDTFREHIMLLLMLQYAGLGIGMMPIFSSGLAVIPLRTCSYGCARPGRTGLRVTIRQRPPCGPAQPCAVDGHDRRRQWQGRPA